MTAAHDWYVVQSHPRKESLVCQRLTDLGSEVFLPLVTERVPGQRRSRLAPLFPSYVFVRLPEGDLGRVRWTHGVRRVLGEGERPRPVGDAIVDTIRQRADRRGRVRLGRRLAPGTRVRIVEGPLAGLVGVLERPAHSAAERVSVLLDVFHRLTRVELAAGSVWGDPA